MNFPIFLNWLFFFAGKSTPQHTQSHSTYPIQIQPDWAQSIGLNSSKLAIQYIYFIFSQCMANIWCALRQQSTRRKGRTRGSASPTTHRAVLLCLFLGSGSPSHLFTHAQTTHSFRRPESRAYARRTRERQGEAT